MNHIDLSRALGALLGDLARPLDEGDADDGWTDDARRTSLDWLRLVRADADAGGWGKDADYASYELLRQLRDWGIDIDGSGGLTKQARAVAQELEGRRIELGIAAVSDEVWNTLRTAVMAAHNRDRSGLIAALRSPVMQDPVTHAQCVYGVRFMAFRSISRRIDHRPFKDEDAVEVTDELMPLLQGFTPIPFADLLSSVRAALHLSPGANVDPDSPRDAVMVVLRWFVVVGLRITDESELESMRADVGRSITRQAPVDP